MARSHCPEQLVLSTATADDWPHGLAWSWPTKEKSLLTKTRVNSQTYRDMQLLSLVRAGKRMWGMQDVMKDLWEQRLTASTVMHCFYSMLVFQMQVNGSSWTPLNFTTQGDANDAHTIIVGLIDKHMDHEWMPLCKFIYENPVVCIFNINKHIDVIIAEYKEVMKPKPSMELRKRKIT